MKKNDDKRQIAFRPEPRIAKLIEFAAKAAGVSVNNFLERLADRYHDEIIQEIQAEQEKERRENYESYKSLQRQQ